MKQPKRKHLSYAKWGYIFIIPFFLSFFIFSLIPLVDTIRYSFYEYYRSGIKEIGPNFVGLENYRSLLESDLLKYAGNTLILWLIGFVPQIVIALLLANWFTAENPGQTVLQGGHLSAQPDYGFGLCHAVLRPVLQQRPHQLHPDEPGDHRCAH